MILQAFFAIGLLITLLVFKYKLIGENKPEEPKKEEKKENENKEKKE